MSHDDLPPIERVLEQLARRLGGGALHPLELLARIQAAAEESATDGRVANDFRVVLHPDDHARFAPEAARMRKEVDRALDALEQRRAWSRIGERRLRFDASPAVAVGLPRVVARFTDTTHRGRGAPPPLVAPPSNPTQRLRRHSGHDVVVDGVTRVPLTHTPFRIGRGPGNDLVLASLAVSREHAEIRTVGGGLAIVDLGSRNGVIRDGHREESVAIDDGRPVTLGDMVLRLEQRL